MSPSIKAKRHRPGGRLTRIVSSPLIGCADPGLLKTIVSHEGTMKTVWQGSGKTTK